MNTKATENASGSDNLNSLVSALDYALDMWEGYAHDAFKDLKEGEGFEAKKYRELKKLVR